MGVFYKDPQWSAYLHFRLMKKESLSLELSSLWSPSAAHFLIHLLLHTCFNLPFPRSLSYICTYETPRWCEDLVSATQWTLIVHVNAVCYHCSMINGFLKTEMTMNVFFQRLFHNIPADLCMFYTLVTLYWSFLSPEPCQSLKTWRYKE